MVLDAGTYTLSMASRYNSRPSPAVLGFSARRVDGGGARVRVLRARERVEDVLRYWNLGEGQEGGGAAGEARGGGGGNGEA